MASRGVDYLEQVTPQNRLKVDAIHVIRGLYLKGSGLDVLWRQGVILLGFGFLNLTVASLRFRKSLD